MFWGCGSDAQNITSMVTLSVYYSIEIAVVLCIMHRILKHFLDFAILAKKKYWIDHTHKRHTRTCNQVVAQRIRL